MPRPRLAPLSQAQLVQELKATIDAARYAAPRSVAETDAINKVIELVRENAASVLSSHVVHNIGCVRRKWCRQLAAMMPNSAEKDLLWRMRCGQ